MREREGLLDELGEEQKSIAGDFLGESVMPRLSGPGVDGLRLCIRPEYVGLPAEELERIIQASISGLPTATAEDFLSTLGSFGKAVAPALERAAPSAAAGAATGSTFGPWGTLIGAGVGLTSSLLSKGKPAPRPAPAPAPAAAPPPAAAAAPAPSPSPTPAPDPAQASAPSSPAPTMSPMPPPPSLPTGQGAAATLLSLIQNPTVQHALLSQVLGSSGNQQVPTATGTSLPRGAINSLLTHLLANASEALPESESISEQSYLRDASGNYRVDPASLEQQAALVLSQLEGTRSRKPRSDFEDFMDGGEWEAVSEADSEGWQDVDASSEAVSFY